jgi:hypothetical protein
MITDFFDKTVDVYRLMDNDDESPGESPSDMERYAAHLTDVDCQIQASDDSFHEDFSGSYKKDFLMFCGVLDINEKDRIADGLDEYVVNGVEVYNFLGNSHMELRITKTE